MRRTIAFGETDGKLSDDCLGEPSADPRARIERARDLQQRQRFAGAVGGRPQVPTGHAEHMQSTDGKLTLLCSAEMPALTQSPPFTPLA